MRRWWQQLPAEQKLRWQSRWWKLRHPQSEDIIRIVWAFLTPIRIIGFTILAIAIIGAANNPTPSPPLPASWGAISVELFGIGIIVLIIDVAYERRAIRQHKTELILQMGSPNNSVALRQCGG